MVARLLGKVYLIIQRVGDNEIFTLRNFSRNYIVAWLCRKNFPPRRAWGWQGGGGRKTVNYGYLLPKHRSINIWSKMRFLSHSLSAGADDQICKHIRARAAHSFPAYVCACARERGGKKSTSKKVKLVLTVFVEEKLYFKIQYYCMKSC